MNLRPSCPRCSRLTSIDWGDWVKVTVNNQMQDNGTSIHWHGIPQRNTNDQDGTSGVTECPIVPGQSRTYLWQATSYGTAWYHSHFSTQYGDGLAGAIVINGPSTADYDVDMGPISLAELYKPPAGGGSATIDSLITHQGPLLDVPENVLFNGTNVNSKGAGQRLTMTVQPNMRYKMRFINSGVVDLYKVGIGKRFTRSILP
jgi:FtsP/CotA-like multicopper oxidase with cupredoxin domain